MGAGGGSRLFWGWWARCAGSSSWCGCWVAVVVGVVLGVSRLASAGGPMGDGGACNMETFMLWAFLVLRVPTGWCWVRCSLVASLAAAAMVDVCVREGGWVAILGLYGGLFCFYLVKYMYFYVIENLLWTLYKVFYFLFFK